MRNVSYGDITNSGTSEPLQMLARWLDEARDAKVPAPAAMTLATVSADGRPSARMVSLKRLEPGALVFTTGLWTRKVAELRANPRVAAVFHWPALGRQARIEGQAEIAERELAEELFASRPRSHQLQALVSRQGDEIDDLGPLRERLGALKSEPDRPVPCPPDWGAVRVIPDAIELWIEAADRLHERLLYKAAADEWRRSRLAP
ncbi:MAG TPA: pyridoxal 5'-phosphate synthase [Solirubrobacterales bacterium]|nr:pyridoxal 5'-phosphate synthase [Solirubrobacterales bacterium]